MAREQGLTAPAGNPEQVRVWVGYHPGRKAEAKAALAAQAATVHYDFDDLEAYVATLPAAAAAALAANPAIELVEEDAKRYLSAQQTPYGIDLTQARQVWDADQDGTIDPGAPTGAGKTVCIIDSGLFAAHEDFAGVNIVGGYPANWNVDHCGHGTHVAGTIAAAMNDQGVVGVSPGGVSLYSVKVFGDNCAWSYASDLADAVKRCEAAGANVINMSLGGGRPNGKEQRAFDQAYGRGVLHVAAAGNDGTTGPASYPAGYGSVVAVAALDSNQALADFSNRFSGVELAAPGVAVLSTVPFQDTTQVTVGGTSYEGFHVENAARGNASGDLVDGGLCDAVGAWAGKTVLCQRGVISFFDKVMNVQNGGGTAAVIYNNADGALHATLGAGNSSTIIAIGLTQADGQTLLGSIGQSAAVESNFLDQVSGYEAWDGTSMATPHVAGAAALAWSGAPAGTSNAAVRSALQGSALDLGPAGLDDGFGHGLIQVKDAIALLNGVCSSDAQCDDGNACNGVETCSASACQSGTAVSCGAGETCNPSSGACETAPICAPKGDSCTSGSECCSGSCGGRPGSRTCK